MFLSWSVITISKTLLQIGSKLIGLQFLEINKWCGKLGLSYGDVDICDGINVLQNQNIFQHKDQLVTNITDRV